MALDTGAPAPILQVQITPTIHLTAPALLIPIAALLGARCLRRGLVVVALGGMLLPPGLPQDARRLYGGPQAELPVYGLMELHYLWVNYT